MATKPLTDEEKRKQISVRGIASLEGVSDFKKVSLLSLQEHQLFKSIS